MSALASVDRAMAADLVLYGLVVLVACAVVFATVLLIYAIDRAEHRVLSERRRVQLLSDAYRFLAAHRAQVQP